MSNRKDGGSSNSSSVEDKLARIRERRAARQARNAEPAPAPPAPEPAAFRQDDDDEDGDERTVAFNIDAMGDLLKDDPAPQAAAAQMPHHDDDGDEGDDDDERTVAFNIDAMGDLLKDDPAPQAAAVEPAPAAAGFGPDNNDDGDDGDDERTVAFSIDAMGDLLKDDPAPAPVASAHAPFDADDSDDDDERTAAFNIDDLGDLLKDDPAPAAATLDDFDFDDAPPAAPAAPAAAPVAEDDAPEEADKTMMVDLDMIDMIDSGAPAPAKPEPEPEPEPRVEPPRLKVTVGNDLGQAFEVTKDKVLVGRGMDADIVISDANASRKHFTIQRAGSGWKLVDLGSGNGTKVDGHKVNQIRLQPGMVIECGQTTMVWEDPNAPAPQSAPLKRVEPDEPNPFEGGDKTQMAAMAALEIDPEWEKRQQGGGAVAESETRQESQDDSGHAEQASSGGGKGKLLAMIGGLVLVLGGGFVAADKFAGLGIVFSKDKPAATVTSGGEDEEGGGEATAKADGVSEDDKAEAELMVIEGTEAFKGKRWFEARKKFNAALDLDADADGAEDGVLAAAEEISASGHLIKAAKAMGEGAWASAVASLRKVPKSSKLYGEAQDQLAQASGEALVDALTKASAYELAGDMDSAKKQVAVALKVAPDDADALAMKEALERATAPDADNLAVEDGEPEPATPKKVAKANMAPGFASYAKGDFMAAINFFDGINYGGAASKRDKAKANAVAAAITKFGTVYSAGVDATKAEKWADAVKNLQQARKFDAAVNGAFRGKINTALSAAYAGRAQSALDAKNLAGAGADAKKALALSKDNMDAAAIAEQVKETANQWFVEAKALADRKPDKAIALLAKVLRVLPESDGNYGAAYKLLNTIASRDE